MLLNDAISFMQKQKADAYTTLLMIYQIPRTYSTSIYVTE